MYICWCPVARYCSGEISKPSNFAELGDPLASSVSHSLVSWNAMKSASLPRSASDVGNASVMVFGCRFGDALSTDVFQLPVIVVQSEVLVSFTL